MRSRIAINGMGRIGRLVLRHAMESECLEVVAVNDAAALEEVVYLLRHDSVHPRPEIRIWGEESGLHWGERRVTYYSDRDPRKLPWRELGIDTVVEATGSFTSREGASRHLASGADYVLIAAPGKEPDLTVCMGVNEDRFDPRKHRIVSNASCTTNCLAPVAMVLDREFGIETGLVTTIHAYTSSQAIVDSTNKKHRRGRAAAISIVPTTTGAAIATTEVLPQLEGRLDGMAVRVPVADGSLVDFVVQTRKRVTVETINAALSAAGTEERLRNVLGATDEELVSADIVGTSYSALVDLRSTMVLGDHAAKVIAWYDNEWGYARRVVELAAYMKACATPLPALADAAEGA